MNALRNSGQLTLSLVAEYNNLYDVVMHTSDEEIAQVKGVGKERILCSQRGQTACSPGCSGGTTIIQSHSWQAVYCTAGEK